MGMLKTGWNFFQNEVLGMASLWRNPCDDCGRSHVCRYFWYTPDCRRLACKRRSTWCRPVFYDECNHAVAALYDYVTRSRKA